MCIHNHQLCINDLAFKHEHYVLFSKLHQIINPGEMIQVRGHNGSGKSTLLRILAGFLEPHKGMVTWNGHCITKNREDYIENMTYIGHLNGIKSNLTVYENLRLKCTLFSSSKDLNIILKKIGLEANSQIHAQNLSAGQLRRLCLAQLMLTSAKLWILDEPNTALDDAGQSLLNTLVIEHIANKGMAVIATHQALTLTPTKTIFLGDHHAT